MSLYSSSSRLRASLPVALVCGLTAGLLLAALPQPAAAQNKITLSTKVWHTVKKSTKFITDPIDDQQTGSGGAGGEADLVSSAVDAVDGDNPLLYTAFDKGSLNSLTDGTIYFRARMGTAGGTGSFDRALFVYIFKPGDDTIDLVAGIDMSGGQAANREVGVWLPGSGANNSPSTTSITTIAANTGYTYAVPNASNFNATLVSNTIQPGVTDLDADNDGNTDLLVSFAIPFSDITSRISGTDENTLFRYVLASATQDNSLNQDLGGRGNLSNADQQLTYTVLGTITDPLAPGSTAFAIPEPASVGLLGSGLLPLLAGFVVSKTRRLLRAGNKA